MNKVDGAASSAVSVAMYDAQLYTYSGYVCIYVMCILKCETHLRKSHKVNTLITQCALQRYTKHLA